MGHNIGSIRASISQGYRSWSRTTIRGVGFTAALLALSPAFAVRAQQPAATSEAPADPAAGQPRKRRQPPPAVIPTAETQAAEQSYRAGRYDAAVTQAKAALNKNERYTPAMLVMAKAYFKLGKTEWMRKLWEMMQANGASDAEKSEIYQLLAFLEVQQQNVPGAIELFKKAADAKPDNAVIWNNLGAQYLTAKNYKDAAPALEKATQLQPGFSKAFLNLGSAYRGLKDYDRAEASYQHALQVFPNYADAVFNLGILYLDADKMPNLDTIARLNKAISYFQKYKQMMGGSLTSTDPADVYLAEAQDKIVKEQKRIERQKKAEERDRQRATQKAAPGAAAGEPPADKAAPAPAAAPASPAPAAAPPASPPPRGGNQK
jgi:pentatricopeptide repeat protein